MKSRFGLILFLCLIFGYNAMLAQVSGKLTGTIRDENNQPLVGANVFVDGTNIGADRKSTRLNSSH